MMPVSRGRKAKHDKALISEVVEESSGFGLYSNSEMLSKLKELALNHGESGVSLDSVQPLRDQALRVREVMAPSDNEGQGKKRKPQQFLKDKSKSVTGLSSHLCTQQRVAKFRRGQIPKASSASCMLGAANFSKPIHLKSRSSISLLTLEDNFKRIPSGSSISDTAKDWCPPNRKSFILVDSAGSIHGSTPVTPDDMNTQELQPIDLDDSSDSSNLEQYTYEHPPRRLIRAISSVSDQFEKMAIPVGPLFQADVPEWSEPSNGGEDDSDSSRWLGTKVWPIEGQNVKTTSRAVGKGRPSLCSCVSPGSTNCIKHHVLEKRRLLQCDLGSVFYIWKFDEMGEEASKSWTPKEQERFELLVKKNMQSSKSDLLMNAVKCFPSKCRKDITVYYFNVFIPRLLSMQTRSSRNDVDSDVDDVKEVYTLNITRRRNGRNQQRGRHPKRCRR